MFEQIIGNNKIKSFLNVIYEPSHAYMFIGENGIGKKLFAKEFAQKCLCVSKTKPCNECGACIHFKSNNNLDFKIVEPDGEVIKVNQIRDLIKDVYEKPIESYKKVYIIDDADKMNIQAQNTLLKILEEPPSYVVIILIGSNKYNFLNTIKSRCIMLDFEKISEADLKKYLDKKGIKVDNKLFKLSGGSIYRLEKIYENQEEFICLENLLLNLNKFNEFQVLKECNKIIKKENVLNMLEYINIILFDIIKNNGKCFCAIKEVEMAKNRLRQNCNFEIVMDSMILNIHRIINESGIDI